MVATTPTQLTIVVPPATGSGKLRVATSAGTAVSGSDFIVPPPSIAVADIVASARVSTSGAAQSIGLYAVNKVGLILFDGNAGDGLAAAANFAINLVASSIAYRYNRQHSCRRIVVGDKPDDPRADVACGGTYTVALIRRNAKVRMRNPDWSPDPRRWVAGRRAWRRTVGARAHQRAWQQRAP